MERLLEAVLTAQADPARLDALEHMLRKPTFVPDRDFVRLPRKSAQQAFQVIAASCICHFRLSEERLAVERHVESLHKVRVALRQLRSALSIFRPIIADKDLPRIEGELRWLAAATNDARDLDTLIARMNTLPIALADARERAYNRALTALFSVRAERLNEKLAAWLTHGDWLLGLSGRYEPADVFASTGLDRLRRQLGKRGHHFRKLDDQSLHRARISAKRLRYAAEFFSGLFPEKKAQRRSQCLIEALHVLQDDLGVLHDAAVVPVMLSGLAVPQANWPAMPKRSELLRNAAKAFDEVMDCKPFWR